MGNRGAHSHDKILSRGNMSPPPPSEILWEKWGHIVTCPPQRFDGKQRRAAHAHHGETDSYGTPVYMPMISWSVTTTDAVDDCVVAGAIWRSKLEQEKLEGLPQKK